MLKLKPIESHWPATDVRQPTGELRIDPELAVTRSKELQDALGLEIDYVTIVEKMHAEIQRRLSNGWGCVEVSIHGRPAWRYWADGRIEDVDSLR